MRLIECADAEGDEFPFLRAGVAFGPTVAQSGDYYGRAVNLASRITGVARPGSVLVDEATKDAVGDEYHYSYAGERKLKGIDTRMKLFRARREPGKRPGEPRDPR
jgi:adenylate cyclase